MNIVHRIIYGKEGKKDISPNEPEKKGFFRFFEILWLKKYKLMLVNLIYFICNLIPTAIAAFGYYLAYSFYCTLTFGSVENFYDYFSQIDAANGTEGTLSGAFFVFYFGLIFVTLMTTLFPVFSIGPCRAGLTHITQCFVRREPVFVWSEYWGKARANLGLSIKVSIINTIVGLVMMFAVAFYLACYTEGSYVVNLLPGWLKVVTFGILLFAVVMFFAMNMFIYPMMITFKVTLKQLYKNSAIIAFATWLPNLGIILLTAVLAALPLFIQDMLKSFILTVILYVVIGLGFSSYLHTFYAFPVLKKYLIDNPNADKSQHEEPAQEPAAPTEEPNNWMPDYMKESLQEDVQNTKDEGVK